MTRGGGGGKWLERQTLNFVVKHGRWQESQEASDLYPGGPNQQFGQKRHSPFRVGPNVSSRFCTRCKRGCGETTKSDHTMGAEKRLLEISDCCMALSCDREQPMMKSCGFSELAATAWN